MCNVIVICPFAPHGLAHGPKTCQIRQHLGQTLRNPYLWNRWMDLYHSKFCGIIWICSCITSWSFDLDPWFWRSNFEKVITQEWDAQLTWNERDMNRWDVRLTLWLWTVTSPMTLPLIFKVKLWKSRNSGMGCPIDVERKGCESMGHIVTLNCDLTHDFDPWFSRSNFEKVVTGTGCLIDMERKGCESTECWTHVVTFNLDLSHDLDPWFSRSNFGKVVTQ